MKSPTLILLKELSSLRGRDVLGSDVPGNWHGRRRSKTLLSSVTNRRGSHVTVQTRCQIVTKYTRRLKTLTLRLSEVPGCKVSDTLVKLSSFRRLEGHGCRTGTDTTLTKTFTEGTLYRVSSSTSTQVLSRFSKVVVFLVLKRIE